MTSSNLPQHAARHERRCSARRGHGTGQSHPVHGTPAAARVAFEPMSRAAEAPQLLSVQARTALHVAHSRLPVHSGRRRGARLGIDDAARARVARERCVRLTLVPRISVWLPTTSMCECLRLVNAYAKPLYPPRPLTPPIGVSFAGAGGSQQKEKIFKFA